MIKTYPRKRIEILLDSPLVPRIVDLLKQADITGWSILRVAGGGTPYSQWQNDDFTGASAKSIVLIVANADKTRRLTELLAPLLDSYRLLLTVGDVDVVRGEKF